jgi:hypothetical protein
VAKITVFAADAAHLAIVLFCDLGHVVGEEHHVRPFLDQRRDLLAQLQLEAVVAACLVRSFEFLHRGVCQENNVDAACQQGIERAQEAAELLSEQDPALAVAKILDGVLVRLSAQVLGQPFFQPVGGVDHQRFERMIRLGELGDGGGDFLPRCGRVKAGDVEVVGAALRIEEDGFGCLTSERRFADAFRSVDDDLLRSGDFAPADGQVIG